MKAYWCDRCRRHCIHSRQIEMAPPNCGMELVCQYLKQEDDMNINEKVEGEPLTNLCEHGDFSEILLGWSKGGNLMSIAQKIEKLEAELTKLKWSAGEPKKWAPKEGDKVFGVASDGFIKESLFASEYTCYHRMLARGRLFRTEAEAIFFSGQELVRAELWALADDEQEWDGGRIHWSISLNEENGELHTSWGENYRRDIPHFKSHPSAQSAIKTVGADRILKYVFGR